MLRHVEQDNSLARVVSIMKLRDSRLDSRLRGFEIGAGDIVLEPDDGATQQEDRTGRGHASPGR